MRERANLGDGKIRGFDFVPDFISESVAAVDFAYLKKIGIRACLIDLDGTVVSRSTFAVDKKIGDSLQASGIKIYIATNRPKSRSLKTLKEDLHAHGVIHPHGFFGKPSKRYYLSALKELNLEPYEVVMIGDRYIQDMLGANRAGIYSLLVYKLGPNHGSIDRFISEKEKKFTNSLLPKYRNTSP